MKKNMITLLALTTSSLAFSQIGMNTPNPKTTLDIVAKNATGKSTNVDGLLIPRVDRERAQVMTGVPVSNLIYIDNIVTGTQTGQAANIDEKGYYYFDGSIWVKLKNANPVAADINIYNKDGELADNRTVTQSDKTLAFTGNAVNAFSVDGNTLTVDAKNNRVGFGTKTPQTLFEIIADNKGSNAENNFYFKGFGSSKEPALILGSANGTEAAPANLANGDFIGSIYFSPRSNEIFNVATGSAINSYYRGDGVSLLTDLVFKTSNAERLRIDPTGNIGIGTNTPTAKLHIQAGTQGALKIVDGTQGINKVLTSDENGVATWKDIPAFGSTNIYNSNGTLTGNRVVNQGTKTLAFNSTSVNGFSVGGADLSVDGLNKRVGIGTINPMAKFHVDGGESRFSTGTSAWALAPSVGGTTGSSNSFEVVDRVNSIRRMVFNDNGDVSLGGSIISNTEAGVLSVRSGNSVGINTGAPKSTVDIVGNTLGIRRQLDSGSSDNMWLDVSNASAPSINAAGAEKGLQFKVGANASGTYGDTGQVITTVATMTPTGNMGIGTETPAASAILDLNSTNKGFLPPRMTTAQRNALTPKPAGLMIYNTDLNCMQYWNTSQWKGDCSDTTTPGTVLTLTCSSAANTGTLANGTSASGVSSTIPYTGGNGGSHGGQAVASTGVTGLTATLSAGSFVTGNGQLTYVITGVPSGIGTAGFAINIGGKTCSLTRSVIAATGVISTLNCAGATNSGTLTGGTAASGVSSTISYTGGNAGSHSGQIVTSTGVTGLTATLSAGNFANGNGTITYTITGNPSAAGTASFAINIGGKTCILTRTVTAPAGSVSGINCAGAITTGTLLAGSTASGVASTISYTGGNGGSHSGQTVSSTGVAGLTATVTAGNFANGNGTLTYTITGTPTSAGPANFAINIGGKTCTLSVPVEITSYVCKSEGTFIDPNNPQNYYLCIKQGGIMYYYVFACPQGSLFDVPSQKCIIQ